MWDFNGLKSLVSISPFIRSLCNPSLVHPCSQPALPSQLWKQGAGVGTYRMTVTDLAEQLKDGGLLGLLSKVQFSIGEHLWRKELEVAGHCVSTVRKQGD